MSNSWVIHEDCLIVRKNENELYFPSAAEIYEFLNSNDKVDLKEDFICANPSRQFPEIKFSNIGSRIEANIDFNAEDEKIHLEIYVNRKGVKHLLKVRQGKLIDHVLIDKEWIFISGNCESFNCLLKETGITEAGVISLAQYLQLIKIKQNYPAVIIKDNLKETLTDQRLDWEIEIPKDINAELYPYQKTGFHWLNYITQEDCGCILGDEMGLGKTLQIITLMVSRSTNQKTPALVVAPLSLLENWKRELNRFAPNLKVLVHHGKRRTGRYMEFLGFNVIVISYNTAVSDLSILKMLKWDMLVLDEAQNIKNPDARRTKAIKMIPCSARIAVTGTPFENHITDIWSLVDFINPGFLGKLSEFNCFFLDDMNSAEKLEPLLSPLLLRRKVEDVAKDLPERIDITQAILMNEIEGLHYEDERQKIIENMGRENTALAMLQKLRMFCTHPFLLCEELAAQDPCIYSEKYSRMCEILEEIVSADEKTILFTSYTKMFEILENDIPSRMNIPVYFINGSTPVNERQNIVDRFSDFKGAALLVLNPRAAGTGLNITAANHVIHYNLEWNPSLEDQASARAYRRGQDKPVFIYRLFYSNTVEEIVNERIEQKRDISNIAVIGTDGKTKNRDDILKAIMMSPIGG